jgi:GR25 family glycosyltransferase involved in LPS biosynthesis
MWPQGILVDDILFCDFAWLNGNENLNHRKAKVILFDQDHLVIDQSLEDALKKSFDYQPEKPVNILPYPHRIHLNKYLKPHEYSKNGSSIKGIDRIVMINLDQCPDKWAASHSELNAWGIVPERFSGINGWALPDQAFVDLGFRCYQGMQPEQILGKVFRQKNSHEIVACPETSYFSLSMSKGAIGCLLSHLSIIQDALNSGIETLWVLEDDIKVIESPHKISTLIEELDALFPSWDGLFTDQNHKKPDATPLQCTSIGARPDFPLLSSPNYLARAGSISANLSKVGMRYGSYSMILRKSVMRKILDFYINHSIYSPYDWDYNIIPNLALFFARQDVVTTDPNSKSNNLTPIH